MEETLQQSELFIFNLFHNMEYIDIIDAIDDATTAEQMKVALLALLDKKLSEGEIVRLEDRDKIAKLRGRVEIHLSE